MDKKVIKYIEDKELVKENDKLIVGISGGADSVCLLLVLLELRKKYQFKIIPVHINHNLRGSESLHDENFVKRLCRKYNLDLQIRSVDVCAYKVKWKLSEEEAGRKIRRGVLEEVASQLGGNSIALGHHRDDNVETAIMHMARGSGLTGVAGISVKSGMYIRPLLCVSRGEVEEYLTGRRQEYCVDSTNLGNDYTRNRVRNQIIPMLHNEVNDNASKNIANLIDDLRGLKEFVDTQVELFYKKVVRLSAQGCIIQKVELENLPEIIQQELIKKAIYSQVTERKDVSRVHIESIKELCHKQVGREISLPQNLIAKRIYDGVEIQKPVESEKEAAFSCIEISINGKTVVEENLVIETQVMEYNSLENVVDNHYTKYFDYDIIKDKLFVDRVDMQGHITINKQGGRQSMKKFCTNQKIASHLRKEVLNVRAGTQVLWVLNYRRCEEARVTEKTKKILKIQIGGQEHGRKN